MEYSTSTKIIIIFNFHSLQYRTVAINKYNAIQYSAVPNTMLERCIGHWTEVGDALASGGSGWRCIGECSRQWLDASHGRINRRHPSELPAPHFVSPKSLGGSSYH